MIIKILNRMTITGRSGPTAPPDSSIALSRVDQSESGYILIVTLVVVLLLALIAMSLLGSNTLQELMAGNLAEKTRAEQAANSALNYAEQWTSQNPSAGIPCTAGTVSTTPVICNVDSPPLGTLNPNDLALPTTSSAAIGTIFSPANMLISTSGGQSNGYYQYPRYYIQYVGLVSDASGTTVGSLYQITAAGYGGNQNAVAIVQAYYRVYSQSTSVTGP